MIQIVFINVFSKILLLRPLNIESGSIGTTFDLSQTIINGVGFLYYSITVNTTFWQLHMNSTLFQYCEFYPNYEKCKKWLESNLPDDFERLVSIKSGGKELTWITHTWAQFHNQGFALNVNPYNCRPNFKLFPLLF